MHLGLLKDCVGGHSYALKMRSSLLLIYVTHAVTYTLVISPTSPLTAWIMHVLTERWHLPLSPPSHVLFHKVYFIITDPCQPEMWSVCVQVCPTFISGFCAHYLAIFYPVQQVCCRRFMKLHNRKWRRTRACVWLSARVFFKAMPHPSFKKQLTYGDQLTCDTLSNRFVLTQMSKWLTSKNISVFHLSWDKYWYLL